MLSVVLPERISLLQSFPVSLAGQCFDTKNHLWNKNFKLVGSNLHFTCVFCIIFIIITICIQDTLVGEACLKWQHQLDISYPVNNGIVQNWDDMGHVWDHVFYSELKVHHSISFLLIYAVQSEMLG